MAKKKPSKTVPAPRADEAPEIPLNQQVCQRVKLMRRRKGWTLEQLASLSGVSRSMLSQIERGTCSPTLGVAYRIAQAFQLTLGELVDTVTPSSRIDVIRSDDEAYLFGMTRIVEFVRFHRYNWRRKLSFISWYLSRQEC